MSLDVAKTLGEKQIRKSLGGGKNENKVNRSIRNVLAKPYDVFWPLADVQSESEMQVLLESLLPAARKAVSCDDRKQLRKMQGKRMQEARKNFSQAIWDRNPGSKELRNFLALGINDVSRGLEENRLASILISNEVDPPILTRHLATLASSRDVPHVVLQNLKECTKKSLDFPSATVGFKLAVSACKENHFHPIHEKILDVFKATVKNVGSSNKQDVAAMVQEPSPMVELKKTYRDPYKIYLTRSSKNCRAFIPGVEVKAKHAWPQYISFSNSAKDENPDMKPSVCHEVLGSATIADTRSFLQKVKDAKKAITKPLLEGMSSGLCVSASEAGSEGPALVVSTKVSDVQKRPPQRYFALAPLKVKRIQGNPNKVKKKQKKKHN